MKHYDDTEVILAEKKVTYEQFVKYPMSFTVNGNKMRAEFAGVVLEAEDTENTFTCGAAGYLVDEGAVFLDGFVLKSC